MCPVVPRSARRECYTSMAAMYGRSTYKECIRTYSFAGCFAPPCQFGCKCPPYQGRPRSPWPTHCFAILLSLAYLTTCLGLSTQNNTCFAPIQNRLQGVSIPKPPRASADIELECSYAMGRAARPSTPSYWNSSSSNSGGRRNPNCVMVGPGPNTGYSRGP